MLWGTEIKLRDPECVWNSEFVYYGAAKGANLSLILSIHLQDIIQIHIHTKALFYALVVFLKNN